MRHKLIFTLSTIVGLVLLISCSPPSAPRYFTADDNQVYALPGEKITIQVNTGVKSLVGQWASAAIGVLKVEEKSDGQSESVKCVNNCIQLILRDSESMTEISAIVEKRQLWGNSIGSKMRDVIIPVDIEVPATATVPSRWSGFLTGGVIVPEPSGTDRYGNFNRDLNVAVTLHVTTLEEIASLYSTSK